MKLTVRFFFTLVALLTVGLVHAQVDTVFNGKQMIIRGNIIVTTDSTGRKSKSLYGNVSRVVTQENRLSAQNDCGVHASFTPEGDSTFSNIIPVTFTSTSTNATSVQWYLNSIIISNQPTFDMWFNTIGLNEIKLVAKNGNCTDTAVAYYLLTGDVPPYGRPALLSQYGFHLSDEFGTAMCTLKDGSYLLGGYSSVYDGSEGDRGMLIKVKPGGCVEWTRLFQGESCRVSSVRALKDSGFLVSVSGFNAPAIYRMDSKGNVKWKFTYKTGSEPLIFRTLYELSDGSIIAGSGDNTFDGFYLLKIAASGNLLWNKYYMKAEFDFAMPMGVAEIGSNIYVSGYISNPNEESQYNSEYNKDGFIISVNTGTGVTNWSKAYGAIGADDFFQDIHVYGNNLLVNDIRSNYLGGANTEQTFHFISTDGTVLKSSKVITTSQVGSPFYTQLIPLSDGRLYLSQFGYQTISLQPGFIWNDNWQKIDTSNNIYWQRVFTSTHGNFQCIDTGKNEKLISLGTAADFVLRPIYNSENFQLVQMDSSGIKDDFLCTFYKSNTTIVSDTIVSVPLVWSKDNSLSYEVNTALRMPNNAFSEMRYSCPDFVDSCSYIKLSGQQRLCDLSATYEYRVSKSHGCFQRVEWDLPEGVEEVTKNDSLLQVRFKGFGTYKIGALLANECNPMKDSIYVVAKSSSSSFLNLGRDTAICSGTSILLKAGKSFLTYQWQDNSRDSNLVVIAPGKYWVEVADSCGNILRDTIDISLAESLQVDLGPDRTKCNSDTLHISAPPGFLNYAWSNNYNISSTTSKNVIVNPLTDTAYFIKAEKTPGCFAYDTVRVHVNVSPPINLGADKSFCSGDSVLFDAGSGFNQYAWSTGSNAPQLSVKTAGTFSVMGTTAEGCKSYDTVSVVHVFSNPVVALDHNHALCTGDSRVLDAGNFSSYLWNDGSASEKITVKDVGTYAVEVKDDHGCKGTDTTLITSILPLPTGFLPSDTLLCSYDKLNLTSQKQYNSYLWSTGTTAPSITISQPGLYWLEVKDANNCVGRDSITVEPKDCMEGFYIPTAFTPNHDGKNDLFRPLLFGKVKKYSFTIYNRWGQVVFQTPDLNKAWDGNVAGLSQDSNVFIWMCTYQFEGEEAKTERGTVMLIR